MEREEQNLRTLLQWASEIGVSDSTLSQTHHSCLGHSLSLSNFPQAGGRGLAASRELRRGELVLRVPKSALMTRESLARDERLASALRSHSVALSAVQILGVGLLYEMDKGKSSWWYPYLLNLPRSYDILAIFGEFERRAMQVLYSDHIFLLNVDEAIWAVERAVSKAELEWKEAIVVMKELKLKPRLLTFKAWLWACATISSRTLHVPWDEAGCLCPVGDLFNYAAPGDESSCVEGLNCLKYASSEQVTPLLNQDASEMFEQLDSLSGRLTDGEFEEDVAAYCFYARRHYKKGEQVLLGYGTYTNLELLEHYGFLLKENPNEKVFIPLEPEICPTITWPNDSMYIHENGKPSFALLSALRLWATPRNQRRSIAQLAYSGSQISVENETLVMRWIFNKCNFLLKSLPTSSKADNLLLDSIDKLIETCSASDLKSVLACSSIEMHAFLEAQGLQNGNDGAKLLSCRKTKLAIDRWRLAIQWRLGYKEILINCMSYCLKFIESLGSKNVSSAPSTS